MKSKLLLLVLSTGIFNANAQWLEITSPYSGNLLTIEFVDQNTGFIGANTAILKTTDGGTTWTSTFTGGVFSINDFSFTSATTGYFAANNSVIGKTTDGADTWTVQDPNVSPFAMLSVSFTDENTGYAVGGLGKISKTTNGGTTWSPQSSGTSEELQEVHFFDASNGITCGKSGKIRITSNGGSSWSFVSSGTTSNLYDMYFADANTGYIAGEAGKILKTTDGGSSWSSLNSGTTEWLYAICFKNSMEGCVGGASGTLLSTIDGGNTWQVENSGFTTQAINDIVYAGSRYIAVSSQGKIITDAAPLGISLDSKNFTQVNMFPNPSSGSITIEIANSATQSDLSYTIADISGKVVDRNNFGSDVQRTLNLDFLDKGVYMMQIYSSDVRIAFKKVVLL